MNFRRWLSLQRDRTDGVGDLARWVREYPPDIVRWGQSDLVLHIERELSPVGVWWNMYWTAIDEFRASERARKAAK